MKFSFDLFQKINNLNYLILKIANFRKNALYPIMASNLSKNQYCIMLYLYYTYIVCIVISLANRMNGRFTLQLEPIGV